MILTDPKWEGLEGGYRIPYDPRPVLSKLASGLEVDHAWDELWNELHHQGDVGEASFAAVTALVDLYSITGSLIGIFSHCQPRLRSSVIAKAIRRCRIGCVRIMKGRG